jgi:hypothetical protein
MKILAIDLGKYKSVDCNYVTARGAARFRGLGDAEVDDLGDGLDRTAGRPCGAAAKAGCYQMFVGVEFPLRITAVRHASARHFYGTGQSLPSASAVPKIATTPAE